MLTKGSYQLWEKGSYGKQGRKILGLYRNALIMDCFLGNAGVNITYYGMARERADGKKQKYQSRLEKNKGKQRGKWDKRCY